VKIVILFFFSENILEQIIRQGQHVVLRLRTMFVIDSIAREIRDPLIISHWNVLNSPTLSCVKIIIMTHGYDTLQRTALVVHVGEKTLKCICRDGRVLQMSYEPQELRDLILCQVNFINKVKYSR
jgi:mediator of RNA polymerase II transcription subunit 17